LQKTVNNQSIYRPVNLEIQWFIDVYFIITYHKHRL